MSGSPAGPPLQVIACANFLGEGVLWDARTQSLWWTDIQGRQLHHYDWAQRTLRRFATPERLGSFGLVAGGGRLIAAFSRGLALYDPWWQQLHWLGRPDAHLAHLRFNDGRVDRQGRFWAGTMSQQQDHAVRGALYSITRGIVQLQRAHVSISNGLCFSPDGTRGYFADSPHRLIHSFAVPAEGARAADWRDFVRTQPGAEPDGACIDAEGCLWSARWGGGCVVRHTPDGRIERVLHVPVSQPTCVCFGGPDLDLLFVTSAREGLAADVLAREPLAGDVLVYRPGVRGLPEAEYQP